MCVISLHNKDSKKHQEMRSILCSFCTLISFNISQTVFQEQLGLMLNKMSFVTGWGFQQYTSFATCIRMMYRQEPLKETTRASDIMSPVLLLENKFLRDVGAPLPALNLMQCSARQEQLSKIDAHRSMCITCRNKSCY